MSPQKRLDMRIQKTIASIRDAFSSLLLEMPFNDITVVLLCERALVNKKTFYRYYPNTLALLVDLQQEYSMPYVELTESLRYPDDLEEIARTFLTYSAEQGELYDRIICNENYAAIQREIVEEMEEQRRLVSICPEGWTKDEWSLYMEFVTGAQVLVYRKWVQDGRRVPIEDMVSIVCALICQGGAKLPSKQK